MMVAMTPRARVTYRGRICGRCLRVEWHPDNVRSTWCGTCHDTTPGQPVALADRSVEGHAADLLRAVRAMVTP